MSAEPRRLFRSRDERMVGGVCGGLGTYLNLDPTVVRLLFVLGTFLGGPGLLVYLIMLLVIPEEPAILGEMHTAAEDSPASDEDLPVTA